MKDNEEYQKGKNKLSIFDTARVIIIMKEKKLWINIQKQDSYKFPVFSLNFFILKHLSEIYSISQKK